MDTLYTITVKTPGLIFLIRNKMIRSPFVFEDATDSELLNIKSKIKTYVNVDFEVTEKRDLKFMVSDEKTSPGRIYKKSDKSKK